MDDHMQAMDAGTIELGRRLDAFARARLSPDPRRTARTRARVLREARLSFEAARIAVHVAPAIAASNRSMRSRLVMPFLAAALWLGIAVGSISAAQAGGPLYPTRMWVEAALLPSDPTARTDAELDRMDARLAEAVSGAARGDRLAVSASLDAYFLIADDAIAGSANDPELEARVAKALNQHRDVLALIAERLADKGNTTASDAIERNIERAIEHNATVILNIGSHSGSPGGGGSSGAGSSGTGGGGSGDTGGGGSTGGGGATGGGAGASDNPPASADPVHPTTPSDKPDRTAKPTPVPPSPDHSPHGPSD
jgi:uncharacterized membrane protein YgcG